MSIIPFNAAVGDSPTVTLPVTAIVAIAPPDDSVDTNNVTIAGTGTIGSFGVGAIGIPITKDVTFQPAGGTITLLNSTNLVLIPGGNRVISNPSFATYSWDGASKWTEKTFQDGLGGLSVNSLSVAGNGTFGGNLSAIGTITAGPAGGGQAVLTPGNANNTGYVAFFNAAGTRCGYLGWAAGGTLSLQANEGTTTQLQVNGNLTVTGSETVGGALTVNSSPIHVQGHVVAYLAGAQGGSIVSYGGSSGACCGMVESGNTLYFGNANGDGSWASPNRMWIDANSNLTINGGVYPNGPSSFNNTINIPYNGSLILMYGQTGFYSDNNYYMLGESGYPTASGQWKYYYYKPSGARNWTDYNNTVTMQLTPGGACYCVGGFATGSDARMKHGIEPATVGMEALRKISPKYFHRIRTEPPKEHPGWRIPDRRELGFIAQDLEGPLPDVIVRDEANKMLAIDIMPMLSVLVNAVKQLDERLTKLESQPKYDKLLERIIALEAKLNQ